VNLEVIAESNRQSFADQRIVINNQQTGE
jgi:hypothetical protein